MYARGLSREDIGRTLCISQATVKFDLDTLREEIDAKHVTHALAICINDGYLESRHGDIIVPQNELVAV